MKRLFSIAAVFSLLVWAMLLVLWIHTRDGTDAILFTGMGTYFELTIAPDWGDLFIGQGAYPPQQFRWARRTDGDPDDDGSPYSFESRATPMAHIAPFPKAFINVWNHATIHFLDRDDKYTIPADQPGHVMHIEPSTRPGERVIDLVFTSWLLLLSLPALLPLCWIGLTYRNHRRRVHRLRNHLCISCGYDLRASTDKCPECGTAIAPLTPSPTGRGPG